MVHIKKDTIDVEIKQFFFKNSSTSIGSLSYDFFGLNFLALRDCVSELIIWTVVYWFGVYSPRLDAVSVMMHTSAKTCND